MTESSWTCAPPSLDRLNYFYGQMLGAQELQREQGYFRDHRRLAQRCLHGHGVVCGLTGAVIEPDACDPCPEDDSGPLTGAQICLAPGLAYNAAGEALLLREPLPLSLWALLPEADRLRLHRQLDAVDDGTAGDAELERLRREIAQLREQIEATDSEDRRAVLEKQLAELEAELARGEEERPDAALWPDVLVRLCYHECGIEPTRPVTGDQCGLTPRQEYGAIRETVRVALELIWPGEQEPAQADDCCGCCDAACEGCELVLQVRAYHPGRWLQPEQLVDRRRPLARYLPTVISGVNWAHAAAYDPPTVQRLLRQDGLRIRFSRPVLSASILPGSIECWVVDGGSGRSGNIWSLDISLQPDHDEAAREVVIRQRSDDRLSHGDRVMIIVRGSQLLDRCHQPVFSSQIGPDLPMLADFAERYGRQRHLPPPPDCRPRLGLYQSGFEPGGDLQSWFSVDDQPDGGRPGERPSGRRPEHHRDHDRRREGERA